MSETYWVVGGVYRDTRFAVTADGTAEQRIGPFKCYDTAFKVWRGKAWATVDDAHCRYRIEKQDSAKYWVVGGTYVDTEFTRLLGGGPAERLGPFDSYDEALETWRGKAWATVDDAHTRYRIERR